MSLRTFLQQSFPTADDIVDRMVLYELQTQGGLTLEQITGVPPTRGLNKHHAVAINEALERLRDLRRDAPSRAARQLLLQGTLSHVLDLGAGLAPWTLALARCSSSVHVLAVDLLERLPDLIQSVDAAGHGSQFSCVGVDVFRDEIHYPYPMDLVLLANICHTFAEQRTKQLLNLAAQKLRPGGTLAIIDQVLDDNPDWIRWSALYAVGASHWAPGGHLYTISEYSRWLHEAEFTNVRVHHLSPLPPLSLITARL